MSLHHHPCSLHNLQLLIVPIEQNIARLNRALVIIVNTAIATEIRPDRPADAGEAPACIARCVPFTLALEVAFVANLVAASVTAEGTLGWD
jgi:hypothetical protein